MNHQRRLEAFVRCKRNKSNYLVPLSHNFLETPKKYNKQKISNRQSYLCPTRTMCSLACFVNGHKQKHVFQTLFCTDCRNISKLKMGKCKVDACLNWSFLLSACSWTFCFSQWVIFHVKQQFALIQSVPMPMRWRDFSSPNARFIPPQDKKSALQAENSTSSWDIVSPQSKMSLTSTKLHFTSTTKIVSPQQNLFFVFLKQGARTKLIALICRHRKWCGYSEKNSLWASFVARSFNQAINVLDSHSWSDFLSARFGFPRAYCNHHQSVFMYVCVYMLRYGGGNSTYWKLARIILDLF